MGQPCRLLPQNRCLTVIPPLIDHRICSTINSDSRQCRLGSYKHCYGAHYGIYAASSHRHPYGGKHCSQPFTRRGPTQQRIGTN